MANYGHIKERFHPAGCYVSRSEIVSRMLTLIIEKEFPKFADHPQKQTKLRMYLHPKITNKFCQDYTDQKWEFGAVESGDSKDQEYLNGLCWEWWEKNTGTKTDVKEYVYQALMYETTQ